LRAVSFVHSQTNVFGLHSMRSARIRREIDVERLGGQAVEGPPDVHGARAMHLDRLSPVLADRLQGRPCRGPDVMGFEAMPVGEERRSERRSISGMGWGHVLQSFDDGQAGGTPDPAKTDGDGRCRRRVRLTGCRLERGAATYPAHLVEGHRRHVTEARQLMPVCDDFQQDATDVLSFPSLERRQRSHLVNALDRCAGSYDLDQLCPGESGFSRRRCHRSTSLATGLGETVVAHVRALTAGQVAAIRHRPEHEVARTGAVAQAQVVTGFVSQDESGRRHRTLDGDARAIHSLGVLVAWPVHTRQADRRARVRQDAQVVQVEQARAVAAMIIFE
jgi:hypothetical protein